jgi:hypothetical protein
MKHVRAGDTLIARGHSFNQRGLIIGVYHSDGSPPYLVRWGDDDREAMFEPGADTELIRADQDDVIG